MLKSDKAELLIEKLHCSYDEAMDIIAKDALIDKGKNPFPLSESQEKESKKARIVEGDIKQRAKPNRIKKVNNDKLDIMKTLLKDFDNVNYINPEREAEFYYNDTKYKIVLSVPRK